MQPISFTCRPMSVKLMGDNFGRNGERVFDILGVYPYGNRSQEILLYCVILGGGGLE